MLFNSIEFLLFFPTVVGLYFLLPFRFRWAWLLAASYFFYGYWNPRYLALILLSTLLDYFCGVMMGRTGDKAKRRPYLYLSLAGNLGLLFTYKYLGFFTHAVGGGFGLLGLTAPLPVVELLLPVGISFYTFQTMSYSIDVYNGVLKPEKHLGVFALFVTYFPQLVAGPIERAGNLLGQLNRKHRFDSFYALNGLKRMVWGMFKKVVIADNLAVLVNNVYNHPTDFEGVSLLLATVFFAFQIYCDFSGYSDIAIGAAQVMGVQLMENFNRPYFSKSISEFWKRWHISLSSWFRDYVYIPLGGNRVVKWRWYYNLFITFLVSGLWHGANWTFITWGALHGLYLVFGIVLQPLRTALAEQTRLSRFPDLLKLVRVLTTFALVCLAWVFFRANTVADAVYVLEHMVTGLGNWREIFAGNAMHVLFLDAPPRLFVVAIASIWLMECIHLEQRHGSITERLARNPAWLRWSVYYGSVVLILLFGNFGQQQFIYFQF